MKSLPHFPSRRQFLRQAGAAAAAVACTGAAWPAVAAQAQARPPLSAPIRPRLAPDVPLEAKIGQMLLLGIRGTVVDGNEQIARIVRDQQIGNIVLFTGNIRSRTQLRTLTDDLRAMAPLPLAIAVDQEGGQIARLTTRRGFPATRSHADLGALADTAVTRAEAKAMATTLAEAGINLNLAPVVDVAVNPDNPIIAAYGRSFSADAAVVAAQAEAYIDGHHEMGVRCTLKHFPGHGSSRRDTHLGFVDVTDTWSEQELLPYQALFATGKADAVMTAHIFNATLDAELPATLSPAVVTGLLREKLGYDGVVITDDLQMRAISDLFRLDRAIELALLAGVDIVSIGQNENYSGSAADTFLATVHAMLDAGTLTEARIDASYRRIARMKGIEG